MRLISRNGYDWTARYPWIVEAALKNRHKQFVIDGEALVLGVDGVSDFNALHWGKHDHEVPLYAFDMLAGRWRQVASTNCQRSLTTFIPWAEQCAQSPVAARS